MCTVYTHTHMRVDIYIRKENQEKWKAIPNKSEWVNALLQNSDDTSRYGTTIDIPAAPSTVVLSQEVPEDDDDEYEDLIYDPIMNGVYDNSLGDYIDADIHMVKELKKRGQVR